MVIFAGYEDFFQIHDGANSQVYRARRASDGQLVILKFLNQDYPTPAQIRRYKQEYHLTCQLDSPGIIKAYALEEWQRSYVIVLEDFGGISLKQWLKQHKNLSLKEFLFFAIAIAESLGHIHSQNIIHKDINPTNIVFNPETQNLKIIDFGISTQLSQENPILKNPNVLEGTLAYISPEQTGRMNRGLDYRTDFYSLGASFYEMLTGKPPFVTQDSLELVHCHIAKQPHCPSDINPSISPIVSEIVMKLMAKNAEDRYQSIWGLKFDLETCYQHLETTGSIESFPLADRDISDRFQIPQKLYGRETETAKLLTAFERVSEIGKVELMLVAGYSGIGKSALVQELYKPITARRGYFIAGKFDQFQRNIPYSAIVVAFRGLIDQLLGENEAKLQLWREKLLQALGNNGQIIIDVIPAVELIIGKQAAVPIVGANEAQNRFNLVLGNFIRVFCDREHPLTLFLDDLQWADLATLQLVERLLGERQTQYLLLLGAYRNNEVSAGHPLAITLEKLQQKNRAIEQITLTSLTQDQIVSLVGDTVQRDPEIVSDLAQLIWEKTGGNPFFLNEFLQALYDESLLKFHREFRGWQWDMGAIATRDFTDNVVELMVEKLQKLPPAVLEILSLAACWGAEFDLQPLTWVQQHSAQTIFERLKIALDRNLIFPTAEPDENLLIQSYKFGHDRIQQAAYTLIPPSKRSDKHASIGRILLARTSDSEQEEKLFDIVDQLNRGIEQINDADDRENLARLNLQAGRKAIESNAYGAAIAYFDTGISLLTAKSWQHQYDLTLSLYQEAAKAAYLNTEIERMEALAATISREAKTPIDRLELGKIKVDAYTKQGRMAKAVAVGLESLAALDIIFPQAASQTDFYPAFAKIKTLIGDRRPADFANLPEMEDSLLCKALTLLVKLAPVTYTAAPALFPLSIFKQVELSIMYGNAPASAFSYASYGMILCGVLEEFTLGYEYGQLALTLLSRFNDSQFEAASLMVVRYGITHWKNHLRDDLQPLHQAFLAGLETGDLSYGGFAKSNYFHHLYFIGGELTETERELERNHEMLAAIGQRNILNGNNVLWQAVLNLRGKSCPSYRLAGKVIDEKGKLMDEKSLISYLQTNENKTGLWQFYVIKSTLFYLFEQFDEALSASRSAQQYLTAAISHSLLPIWCFYKSLAQLALMRNRKQRGRERIEERTEEREKSSEPHTPDPISRNLNEVRENQTQLKRWAESAPMNHLHKFYLVEAEYHRVLGEKAKAIEFYNLAIAKAKENEYIQEEALANELTAKFYLNWGFDAAQPHGQATAARAYMMEAHYCYTRWGATAKVKHLEDNYPQLCQSSSAKTFTTSFTTSLKTHATVETTEGATFDLASVMKATNAISSEIVLENLLATLMNILVENAGAHRGILILPRGDRLFIEAIKETDSEDVAVLQSLPLDECEQLSSKIVHYVARIGEMVVLNDATREGNFIDDTYIQQCQCQSIACTPLRDRGQLQGIIYLENNLTTGAFTQERMALLRTLAAQAAISLENARLYDKIAVLNAAYERFVPAQFLSFLEKESIVDVVLGDQVEREMTVLFSDIRDFTTLSEQMTPEENFAFINEYLGYMEPQIRSRGGFVDKYIGDAIMALFPDSADSALQGAIAMLEELKKYNQIRQTRNQKPLQIGIGLHTGSLILGTVGGFGRMDGTAIGDAVNLSSRVEDLTKTYGTPLLITNKTLERLKSPSDYDVRFIEQVKVKGKTKAVDLFEVFSADLPELRAAKTATKTQFEQAVLFYQSGSFDAATGLFEECVNYHIDDCVARSYLERCHRYTAN